MSKLAVDTARDSLHRAGVADRMRELSRREHYDAQAALAGEQEPAAATWDDVELHELGTLQQLANMRACLDANRIKWSQRVGALWEARLAELDARWQKHAASNEHATWLAEGGPARLWDRLSASRSAAQRQAAVVREAKGDPAAFDAIAELEQWRMDEMVGLYLNQEAAE
jgi:hypothetical protein